jgi:chromosome segregation ATPase
MNKQSLEKSLAFLAPSLTSKKKAVSPVQIPDILSEEESEEEFDVNALLEDKDDEIQETEEESEEESEEEVDEEEIQESEEESEEEVDEEEIQESDEEESEEEVDEEEIQESEEEDEEVEIKTTTSTSQLTPTRLKISFPRSPKKPKANRINDLKSKLKNLRYSIIKLIMNEDESNISYAVCFDPNGEIVFVDLKEDKVKVFDEEKIIKVSFKDEKLNMSTSFIEGIRNRLTFEIYGVVFYDGLDYSFVKRDEEGNLFTDNFTTSSDNQKKSDNLPFVYSVIDLNSLIKDPVLAIKRTKLAYQIIQDEQVESNKFTISSLMETSRELTSSLQNFEKTYRTITRDIVDDWKKLSEYSSDYYDKFNEEDLTEEEKETFDKVTVNMFARFQIFNEQVEKVDSLTSGIEKIRSSIYTINTTIQELKTKSDNLKNKIIDINELELYT